MVMVMQNIWANPENPAMQLKKKRRKSLALWIPTAQDQPRPSNWALTCFWTATATILLDFRKLYKVFTTKEPCPPHQLSNKERELKLSSWPVIILGLSGTQDKTLLIEAVLLYSANQGISSSISKPIVHNMNWFGVLSHLILYTTHLHNSSLKRTQWTSYPWKIVCTIWKKLAGVTFKTFSV